MFTKGEWKLTDEETARVLETGDEGDVIREQDAKKKAYTANGGVILNPDALEDMYEALKEAYSFCDDRVRFKMNKALAKAEGK